MKAVRIGRTPAPRNDPAPKLRPARLADAPELLAMMKTFNRSEGIPWRAARVDVALRRLLREARLGQIVVAEHGASRRLLGYVVATFNYDLEFAGPDAFITELFVQPDQRGRGLGRRLLDAAASKMRAAGAGALHLLVHPDNRSAHALYERAGFRTVPRLMMTRLLRQPRPGKAATGKARGRASGKAGGKARGKAT